MKFNIKENLISKPEAVMFDLDNTLYNYSIANNNAENALKNAFESKLGFGKQYFGDLLYKSKVSVKAYLKDTASSHSRLLYIQKMLEEIGLGSELSLMLELEQTYWTSFFEEMNLFPGVIDLLEEFRLLEIPCGIITDLTSTIQFRKLIYLNLEKYFKIITTSEEVEKDKPKSEIFLKSKAKINDKKNLNIWMFGDSVNKDIIGAKKSINATTFLKNGNADESTADIVFSEFTEIILFLKKLKTT